MTKLALVWSAERAGREIDAIWEKRQAVERKRADYDDTLRAKLIEAKANYDGSFKEFVERHTHISLTTAKRTLRIADGRGEEVRQQERERQQRHRGRDNPPVTPSPPITAAEGVKLVASQGATMTEPEVAECLRLAGTPEAEFEKHIEDTVAAEVASLVPEPVGQFPVIDFTFVGKRLTDIDRLFSGLGYNSETKLRFDTDNIDLELYDALERVAEKVRIIAQSLGDVPVIEEARNERTRAEHERRQAERKAEAEAAEAARVARITWEIDHGEEARKAYYAEALTEAKENDGDDFEQVEFDASYGAGEGGYVGFDNPEREFFKRWRKEHHTIWPGHLEAEPDHVDRFDGHKQRNRLMKQLMAAVNLDHIADMKKARKLYDAADHHQEECDFEAMCALADFMKAERPKCAPPSLECDHKVDPVDAGHQDRYDALDAWERQNSTYITATAVLSDKLWRHEEPKEAAEHDRKQAKEDAETKKRLIADAKSPGRVKAKALKDTKRDAMDSDMEEEKESCRENGERWGDVMDEWITNWEAENWGDEEVAEAEKEFLDEWEFEHGQAFPASNYG
jgi:hypothetical protein